MPAAPEPDSDFMSYLGYWTALQGFLTYSFGWTRHDRGLRWWYEAGRPMEDARFALIDATWGQDGLLLSYLEWCHDRRPTMVHQPLAQWTTYDALEDELSPHWTRLLRDARGAGSGATSPHGKHLEGGDHAGGPAQAPNAHVSLQVVGPKRAALIAETSTGWYRALTEQGNSLPATGTSGWRVDVFTKPIGFMGTYRRSWETGLWFSGPHRLHSVGN